MESALRRKLRNTGKTEKKTGQCFKETERILEKIRFWMCLFQYRETACIAYFWYTLQIFGHFFFKRLRKSVK
jgi:hypothetical protein